MLPRQLRHHAGRREPPLDAVAGVALFRAEMLVYAFHLRDIFRRRRHYDGIAFACLFVCAVPKAPPRTP
jgi:hypothetical protein